MWDEYIVKIHEWLDSHNNYPDLSILILSIVYNWTMGHSIELVEDVNFDNIKKVSRAQKDIG